LAVAIANEIWGMRPVLDPASQKQADRLKIASVSNDYDLANRLVPDQPHVSDSTHDTELAFGTLMQGLPVTPKPDPKALAQAENIRLQGEQKRQASSQSHAQRTAERQITFEQKIKQDTQRFELETQKQIAQLQIDLEKARQELALERERHAQDQVQEEPAAQP
jgi:hypothetical protein